MHNGRGASWWRQTRPESRISAGQGSFAVGREGSIDPDAFQQLKRLPQPGLHDVVPTVPAFPEQEPSKIPARHQLASWPFQSSRLPNHVPGPRIKAVAPRFARPRHTRLRFSTSVTARRSFRLANGLERW